MLQLGEWQCNRGIVAASLALALAGFATAGPLLTAGGREARRYIFSTRIAASLAPPDPLW